MTILADRQTYIADMASMCFLVKVVIWSRTDCDYNALVVEWINKGFLLPIVQVRILSGAPDFKSLFSYGVMVTPFFCNEVLTVRFSL